MVKGDKGAAFRPPFVDVPSLEVTGEDNPGAAPLNFFPPMYMSQGPVVVALVDKLLGGAGRVGLMAFPAI